MIYEVVTGIVRIDKRKEFVELHRVNILPVYARYDLKIICCLLTEVGEFGRFLDVYQYDSYAHYEQISEQIYQELNKGNYYSRIRECIEGNISISIMTDFKNIT